MTTIEIYGTERRVKIPSAWWEMTAKQVRDVFKIYGDCLAKGRSPLDFNVQVLYYFLGIRPSMADYISTKITDQGERMAQNIYRLCEKCLKFLFTETDGAVSLSYDVVANPLPEIKGRCGLRLYGPSDLLSDLTFGEFRQASSLINMFFKGNDESALNECIAVLYRPKSHKPNKAGRYVDALNANAIERGVKMIAKVPSWQKSLIMMWFSACLKYLQGGRIVVDGEEIDMSQLFAGESEGSGSPAFTWNDLAVQIARDQTIGNRDAVDEEPLFSILSLMWSNYKENLRHEKIRKAHKG